MIQTQDKLTYLVTSFTSKEQYNIIEKVFDSFGGKFMVKKDGDHYIVLSDEMGDSLFSTVFSSSSVLFMV